MKVALAQIDPIIGDLKSNVEKCLAAIERGRESRADLVILPEMAMPGGQPRDILNDRSFADAALEANADLAARAKGCPPAIFGTILRSDTPLPNHPSLLNAAVLIRNGEQALVSAKRDLQARDVFFEPRWFVPGQPAPPIEISGRRLKVAVGDDIWSECQTTPSDGVSAIAPPDILIGISASPFCRGIAAGREKLGQALKAPLLFANLCGANDELVYDGNSFATNGNGKITARLAPFREDFIVVDTDVGSECPEVPSDPDEELFEALVAGIRGFAFKNRIERLFVGLSGGVDSAVVAALASAAMPPENVTAIAVPSRHTDQRSTDSARELASSLGIAFEVVPLEPLHSAAEKLLGPLLEAGNSAENIQARLRATVLMALVNSRGGMLLNTSNKTELALGYSTLYGDSAGTLCPIGDLTKPEVVSLAKWINGARHKIPSFILERPPTAELSPGQVDPFDYGKISPAIENLVRSDQSDSILRRSEHKRWQMGVILKVSPRAFGTGRLMPITRR